MSMAPVDASWTPPSWMVAPETVCRGRGRRIARDRASADDIPVTGGWCREMGEDAAAMRAAWAATQARVCGAGLESSSP